MKIWNPNVLRFVGVLIFLYLVFFKVGVGEFGQRLVSMDLWIMLVVFPINWLQWGVRALRWRILLRNDGIDIPLRDIYVLGCASIMLGCATPGRVGEFIKVKFLMNNGYGFRAAFLSSFIERLLDLGTLMLFVAFGLIVCFPLLPQQMYTYVSFMVLILFGAIGLIVFRKEIQGKFLKMLPNTISGNVNEKLSMFMNSLRKVTYQQWGWLLGYSMLVWTMNYLMIYLLYMATGNTIAVYYAFAFAAIGSLAGLIPLSIFGAGIREPIYIVLFTMLGYTNTQANHEGLLYGFMFIVLLLIHILTGFVCWMSPIIKPYLSEK